MTTTTPVGALGWKVATDRPVRWDGEHWRPLPPDEEARVIAERDAHRAALLAELDSIATVHPGWTLSKGAV